MYTFPPYAVFSNLPSFLQSRKLRSRQPADFFKNPCDFVVAELDLAGLLRVDAEDATGQRVVIILLAPSPAAQLRASALTNLFNALEAEHTARVGRLDEVIIIAPQEMIEKKNIANAIARAPEANNAPVYSVHSYAVFAFDFAAALHVPAHSIVPADEAEKILASMRLSPAGLRKITASDAPIVWIGGRPGQMVRIRYPSETAGESIAYAVVTR